MTNSPTRRPVRRPRPLIHCLVSLALLVVVPPAVAQRVAAGDFEESTTVIAVEVPVRVLLGGEPVYGLTAEDFEVFDDGVEREITAFGVLDAAAREQGVGAPAKPRPSSGTAEPEVAPQRNFLLLFDFAWAGVGIVDSRRKLEESVDAARQLVDSSLADADRVAVAYYSPLRGLKLLHDFTTDRDTIRFALHVMELVLDAKPERLRDEVEGWAHLGPSLSGYRARTALGPIRASLDDLIAETRISAQRGDPFLWHGPLVKHLAWGLREMIEQHDPPGMKYVVLFSRGPLFGDEAAYSLFYLQELFRDLRQANWAIEAVDTGGQGFGRDSLQLLAHETGGSLFTNSRHLDRLVSEVAESTRLTYVLTFQVEELPDDGRFHEIDVRLVDGPKRARLTHRPGYYAPGAIDPKWRRSLRPSGTPRSTDEPALTGLDPVYLVAGREIDGREDLTVVHDDFRYLFADQPSLERFLASPDEYAIRLGGDCPVVDGLQGDADFYAVHDGGIYIFSSSSARRRFLRHPERYLADSG